MMNHNVTQFLAYGIIVVMVANIVVSWRTGDWNFVSVHKASLRWLFTCWAWIVTILAVTTLTKWIDAFAFIVVAVGGQILWQTGIIIGKLTRKDAEQPPA